MDPEPDTFPRLAAGVRVVARGRDRLQAGITLDRQVVVATESRSATAMELLQHGRRLPGEQRDLDVITRLDEAGLLARPRARERSVLVIGDLGSAAALTRALHTAGLERDPESVAAPSVPGLLVASGEPERELIDPWLLSARPHLLVRLIDGVVTVGPFVVPGETACLRCIDAHRQDVDPEYVAVLYRYIHEPRLDGCTDEGPPAAAALALACAARDLSIWREGGRPVTLSTTVALMDTGVNATSWLRHPECVCGQGDVS